MVWGGVVGRDDGGEGLKGGERVWGGG